MTQIEGTQNNQPTDQIETSSCKKCTPDPKQSEPDPAVMKTYSRSVYRRSLPEKQTALSSTEGKARFARAMKRGHAEVFFDLIANYQTQSEPSYCGLTTLSMILNTLSIDPRRIWKFPWRWYTEEMLECCLTLEEIRKNGLTMDQLRAISRCEGALTRAYRGKEEESVRGTVKECVGRSDRILVACYDRKVLGQTGSGHFSPIAAYDEVSDSVLILDTARFKYTPHWVDLSDLVNATRSVDPQTGVERGFLTFERKENPVQAQQKDQVPVQEGKCKSSDTEHCCSK